MLNSFVFWTCSNAFYNKLIQKSKKTRGEPVRRVELRIPRWTGFSRREPLTAAVWAKIGQNSQK